MTKIKFESCMNILNNFEEGIIVAELSRKITRNGVKSTYAHLAKSIRLLCDLDVIRLETYPKRRGNFLMKGKKFNSFYSTCKELDRYNLIQ